jgi:hypothetical protein
MTQSSLDFTASTPATFRDRLAAYLLQRPGIYIDGLELAKVGGAYAFRTRISELRTQLGMDVRNRQRKRGHITISEYAYFPCLTEGK